MKKYKIFFLTTILLTAILTSFLFIIGDYCIKNVDGLYYKQDELAIFVWLRKKEKISAKLNKGENTIVLIAGSSVLFGTNSYIIENITGKNIINLGTHAGLTDYLFIWAQKNLKKGNIVVVPAEFGTCIEYNSLSDLKANYVIANDKDAYRSFDFMTKLKYINYFLTNMPKSFSVKKKNEQIEKLENRIPQNKWDKMYDHKYWNAKGDVIVHNAQKTEDINKIENFYFKKYKKLKLSKNFINFVKWCKDNDIEVYVTYPMIFPYKDRGSQEAKEYYENYKNLFIDNNINFIGKAEDSFMEKEDFLDSESHLNKNGADKRSVYLGNLINKYILN